MTERQQAVTGVAALLGLVFVAVNVAIFTWLYAPVMLAVEFSIVVFTLLTVTILRSACCDRRALQ